MKSFSVISAFNLSNFSFKKLDSGFSAFESALKKTCSFPHCDKLLILNSSENTKKVSEILEKIFEAEDSYLTVDGKKVSFKIQKIEKFTAQEIFTAVANFFKNLSQEYKNVFFVNGDAPFYDLNLTRQLYEQHLEYGAEYSFVDGYPEGFAPEIIAAGLATILAEVSKTMEEITSRSFIFDTVKKEINNYDIETIIAPHDLRHLRLQFICNNKRNTALCNRFLSINAENYADLIREKNEELFTYPAYYAIEVNSSIAINSIYNPPNLSTAKQMSEKGFSMLIDKIAEFSDDAIISLSIFGEPALHKNIPALIEKILSYPKLSVLIETSGIGWEEGIIEKIEAIVKNSLPRKNQYQPIYWIVGIDAVSSAMYAKVHQLNETEANTKLKLAASFADKLNKFFKNSVWTQIVRMNENEAEIEPFYRFWKEAGVSVIIQKYNTFCKVLEDKRVADLSPFYRHPCWHIKRDLYIFTDGTVPMCREDFNCKNKLGNAFTDSFESIDKKAFEVYKKHLNCKYGDLCGSCDEYYTYNF